MMLILMFLFLIYKLGTKYIALEEEEAKWNQSKINKLENLIIL